MKKLTLLMMACCMAIFAYAQPWTITYVLPQGAVTNPHGWQSKEDMWQAYMAIHNLAGVPGTNWRTLDEYRALSIADQWNLGSIGFGNIFAAANVMNVFEHSDPAIRAEWAWLRTYLIDFVTQAGGSSYPLDVTTPHANAWRGNFAGFWPETRRYVYPTSANFSAGGHIEAFQRAWRGGFVGPAEYEAADLPITIPAPFLAEHTFLGWFTQPDGGGEGMNVISDGTTGNLVLYAHFDEFVFTAADIARNVAAEILAVGDEVKSIGVVIFVMDNTVYFQSAIDGSAMTVTFAALPDGVVVGRELLVEGKITALGTAYVLTNATVISNNARNLPVPAYLFLLSTLESNKFKFVHFLGLRITAINGNNVTVRDVMDNTATLVATLPDGIGIGNRINVIGVVSYDGTDVGLLAHTSGITATPTGGVHYYRNYPDMETDGADFTLENKWLISHSLGNYAANAIAPAQSSRAMVAKNGRMYFTDRVSSDINVPEENHGIVVIDTATGERLNRINFRNSAVFRNVETSVPMGTSFNDLKLDCAGNFVSISLVAGSTRLFQIWVLDMEEITNSRMLLNSTIRDELRGAGLPEFDARIDYIDVFGDVNGDAIIMAAGGNSTVVFKWTIKDRKIVDFDIIVLDLDAIQSMIMLPVLSAAAYIHIVDENHFFIDTMNDSPAHFGLPMLFNMGGEFVDGFFNIPRAKLDIPLPHNAPVGLAEFTLRGFHFLVTAYGNTNAGTIIDTTRPSSSFRLYRYADSNKRFVEIEPMWVFPRMGMGNTPNHSRVVIPSVIVNEADGTAYIHVWYVDNGYGVYKFTVIGYADTGLTTPEINPLRTWTQSGLLHISGLTSGEMLSIYSVTGALIYQGRAVSSEVQIPLNAQGVYIIRSGGNAVKVLF